MCTSMPWNDIPAVLNMSGTGLPLLTSVHQGRYSSARAACELQKNEALTLNGGPQSTGSYASKQVKQPDIYYTLAQPFGNNANETCDLLPQVKAIAWSLGSDNGWGVCAHDLQRGAFKGGIYLIVYPLSLKPSQYIESLQSLQSKASISRI